MLKKIYYFFYYRVCLMVTEDNLAHTTSTCHYFNNRLYDNISCPVTISRTNVWVSICLNCLIKASSINMLLTQRISTSRKILSST